jgi:hypothetical protein
MCHVGIGWFVDHKVVVYWVAAIAPGPLPSYAPGLAPASPGESPGQNGRMGDWRGSGMGGLERGGVSS